MRALDVAISQIGVREDKGINDGVPQQRYMDGDRLPWCAGFVLWCFIQADGPDVPGAHYPNRAVSMFENNLKKRGIWFGPKLVPLPNDIVFFSSRDGSDLGRGRHCGIVENVLHGMIHTIEGNVSNRVARRSHRVGSERITGFGRITEEVP